MVMSISSRIDMRFHVIFSILPARLQGRELHCNRTESHNEGRNHEEGFGQENDGNYL